VIVLGLDTTGSACSVSLVDEAVVLAHVAEDIGRGHAERLAGMVAQALEAANLTPQDIDRLAVCTGPGNFTGLRVALSFAKGFALPRNLPVLGINALEVTATDLWISDEQDTEMAVYRDIRRGEAFYCSYKKGRPLMMPLSMLRPLKNPLKSDSALKAMRPILVFSHGWRWTETRKIILRSLYTHAVQTRNFPVERHCERNRAATAHRQRCARHG